MPQKSNTNIATTLKGQSFTLTPQGQNCFVATLGLKGWRQTTRFYLQPGERAVVTDGYVSNSPDAFVQDGRLVIWAKIIPEQGRPRFTVDPICFEPAGRPDLADLESVKAYLVRAGDAPDFDALAQTWSTYVDQLPAANRTAAYYGRELAVSKGPRLTPHCIDLLSALDKEGRPGAAALTAEELGRLLNQAFELGRIVREAEIASSPAAHLVRVGGRRVNWLSENGKQSRNVKIAVAEQWWEDAGRKIQVLITNYESSNTGNLSKGTLLGLMQQDWANYVPKTATTSDDYWTKKLFIRFERLGYISFRHRAHLFPTPA